jgi:hypothetical protein
MNVWDPGGNKIEREKNRAEVLHDTASGVALGASVMARAAASVKERSVFLGGQHHE